MPRDTNGEPPPADGKAVIIVPGAPLTVAQLFLDRIYADKRHPRLLRHRGTFYRWDGTAWGEIAEEPVRAQLYEFLGGCLKPAKDGRFEKVEPNIRLVSEVLAATKAEALIADDVEAPAWIGESRQDQNPNEIVAFKNGLLYLPTGALIPPTPEFFTLSALDIDWYGEAAPMATRWLEFLNQIWPDDQESISTLQRIFGYLLTPDTRLQKSFMIVGPPRSGKGTIGRVLTALVGKSNTASPALSALGKQFGMQSLIGKRLAVVGDAKIGRDSDPVAIAEHILGITGEDSVTVPRKNLPDWIGRLTVKLLVLCTEVPKMTDDSAGIASRFVILRLTQSFLGKEDTGLTDLLMEELPGIALWALGGWHAIFGEKGDKKIPQPGSAMGHVGDFNDLSSDIKQYLDERCDFDTGYRIPRIELYKDYCSWREAQGRPRVNSAVFGRKLRTAFPGLGDYHPPEIATSEKRPPREYCGLRLQT